MGNTYKSKAERLKGDPYTGVCFQALETLEHLCLIQTSQISIRDIKEIHEIGQNSKNK